MKTDELIVELARSVRPVRPLAPPLVRLARWIAAVVPVAALGAMVIGLRADVQMAVHGSLFLSFAIAALVMTLLSAAAAFVLSVPGAERSPILRAVAIVAGLGWAGAWVVLFGSEAGPVGRILTTPIHVSCVLEIAAFGLLAGWTLVTMLRRAAPLDHNWSAVLASFAAAGLGATVTHFICPIDDPAHQLGSHVAVVMLASLMGAFTVRRSLGYRTSQ